MRKINGEPTNGIRLGTCFKTTAALWRLGGIAFVLGLGVGDFGVAAEASRTENASASATAQETASNKEKERALRQAAYGGDGDAALELGKICEKRDDPQAVRWYIQAAEAGNAFAASRVGVYFEFGLNGVKRNVKEAARWYRQAADGGDLVAINNLGGFYLRGAVEKDAKKAVELFRRAAEGGLVVAARNLGLCLADGNGVERNYEEAVRWLRKAADGGDVVAARRFGLCYANGDGVEQSDEEAIRWTRRYFEAADKNDERARSRFPWTLPRQALTKPNEKTKGETDASVVAARAIAESYVRGDGVEPSDEQAARWLRRGLPELEAEGKTDAEADVVVARTFGWVLNDAARFTLRSKEATESVRWFRKAAEAGDASAALGLGGAYASGRGVPKDVEEAARWFRKAADAGNAEAARRLGIRFLEGLGVERNEEEGIGWFRRALAFEGRLGATDAETEATAACDVGYFYFDLVGSEEKALPWLRKAAEAGDVKAASLLGGIYANGGGYSDESENPFEDAPSRQPNYAEAARWYRQAAEAGDAEAAFGLALLYDEGRGVERNAAEAERWRRKAEELGRRRIGF